MTVSQEVRYDVWAMRQQGLSVTTISRRLHLTRYKVEAILAVNMKCPDCGEPAERCGFCWMEGIPSEHTS